MRKKATAKKPPEQKEREKKVIERTYRGGCHCGRIRLACRQRIVAFTDSRSVWRVFSRHQPNSEQRQKAEILTALLELASLWCHETCKFGRQARNFWQTLRRISERED
jgi:hypothetical protein